MQYRYDQLQFSTLLPNWINIGNLTSSIACSGTIANGSGMNFTTSITLDVLNTFSDTYLINQNTNKKVRINNNLDIDLIWQYVSSETVTDTVSYVGSVTSIKISVVNNTGGSITLVNQTYTVEIVEYEMPI